jgi:peptidoglycan/LPS O-acetylase OafA/YrhL
VQDHPGGIHQTQADQPTERTSYDGGVTHWRLRTQPAWQGVRALAVLAVMGRHFAILPGGWLGVEIFFVLSGFLITTLLLGEAAQGALHVRRFYLRRLARLTPAVFLLLTTVIIFSVIADSHVRDTLIVALATMLYSANWVSMSDQNLAGLGHMWSLSIEEQFYFLWPLILLLIYRRWRSLGVGVLAGIGALTSLVLRALLAGGVSDQWYQRVYYGTDTRAAGLLIGCVAAVILRRSEGRAPKSIHPSLAWLAALVIGVAVLIANPQSSAFWQVGVGVIDLAVVVVLMYLVDSTSVMARVLAIRPLVYIGDISYGVYLWHLSISWAVLQVTASSVRFPIQIILPFVLAALSYRFFENPIRLWARHGSPARGAVVRTSPAQGQ